VQRPLPSLGSLTVAFRWATWLRWLAVLCVAVGALGCGDSTGPTPTPTPTPHVKIPPGKPDATALENLALVRGLDEAAGHTTILVAIGNTRVGTDGRAMRGADSWEYGFAPTDPNELRIYWSSVDATGHIRFLGFTEPTIRRFSYTELEPLPLDSSQIVALALAQGGQRFWDKYPGSFIGIDCRWIGGRSVWEVGMRNRSVPDCYEGFVFDARTGELLVREPSSCV
jgi:hypothetical protein